MKVDDGRKGGMKKLPSSRFDPKRIDPTPDGEIAEIRGKNSFLLKRTLGSYYLLGVATMMLVPENLVANLSVAKRLSESVGVLIPAISALPAATTFPESASIFMLVMWLTLPVPAVRIFQNWTFPSRIFLLNRKDQWFLVGSAFFLAALFLLFISFFPDMPREKILASGGRGSWFVRILMHSQVSLGCIGSLVFITAAAVFGITTKLAYLVAVRHKPELTR